MKTVSPSRLPGRRPALASTFAALFAGAVLGCGPLVMIPGGALSGTEAATPADWSFSDAIDTVQLETRPDDPYSVNVWGVAANGGFYIAAGDATSGWAQNIEADSRVRLKIEDAIYPMRATRVTSEADYEAFARAAKAKYDFEPTSEQRENAALFRLTPR